MNRREKILGVTVALILVIALGIKFLPEDISLKESLIGGGELRAVRSSFLSNLDWLRQGPYLLQQYERVEAQFPEKIQNQTASTTFSNELFRLLEENGVPKPEISKTQEVEFKDQAVQDYYFIDVDIRMSGTLEKMVELLILLQRKGVLIQSFGLEKTTANLNKDKDLVTLAMTARRLAKVEEADKKRKRRRRS